MTRLAWGDGFSRQYDNGLDRGVLYVDDDPGVPWDGLVSVSKKPSGGGPVAHYLDGQKYLNYSGPEESQLSLTALYSPYEFDACDGSMEIVPGFSALRTPKKPFGLCYRTFVGNAVDGNEAEYKLHIIYNALVSPTTRTHTTIGDNVSVAPISWEITTTPVSGPDGVLSAEFVVDSTRVDSTGLQRLEDVLYGTELTEPRLPDPDEVRGILTDLSIEVINNLDGSFTIIGPDSAVRMIDDGVFEVTSWTARLGMDGTFNVRST